MNKSIQLIVSLLAPGTGIGGAPAVKISIYLFLIYLAKTSRWAAD
jgi:hypothetical protein